MLTACLQEQVDEVVKDDKKALVSGAVTGEEEAFPKEAVKSFHEKPQPTHENKHAQKPKIIQQPRSVARAGLGVLAVTCWLCPGQLVSRLCLDFGWLCRVTLTVVG